MQDELKEIIEDIKEEKEQLLNINLKNMELIEKINKRYQKTIISLFIIFLFCTIILSLGFILINSKGTINKNVNINSNHEAYKTN